MCATEGVREGFLEEEEEVLNADPSRGSGAACVAEDSRKEKIKTL